MDKLSVKNTDKNASTDSTEEEESSKDDITKYCPLNLKQNLEKTSDERGGNQEESKEVMERFSVESVDEDSTTDITEDSSDITKYCPLDSGKELKKIDNKCNGDEGEEERSKKDYGKSEDDVEHDETSNPGNSSEAFESVTYDITLEEDILVCVVIKEGKAENESDDSERKVGWKNGKNVSSDEDECCTSFIIADDGASTPSNVDESRSSDESGEPIEKRRGRGEEEETTSEENHCGDDKGNVEGESEEKESTTTNEECSQNSSSEIVKEGEGDSQLTTSSTSSVEEESSEKSLGLETSDEQESEEFLPNVNTVFPELLDKEDIIRNLLNEYRINTGGHLSSRTVTENSNRYREENPENLKITLALEFDRSESFYDESTCSTVENEHVDYFISVDNLCPGDSFQKLTVKSLSSSIEDVSEAKLADYSSLVDRTFSFLRQEDESTTESSDELFLDEGKLDKDVGVQTMITLLEEIEVVGGEGNEESGENDDKYSDIGNYNYANNKGNDGKNEKSSNKNGKSCRKGGKSSRKGKESNGNEESIDENENDSDKDEKLNKKYGKNESENYKSCKNDGETSFKGKESKKKEQNSMNDQHRQVEKYSKTKENVEINIKPFKSSTSNPHHQGKIKIDVEHNLANIPNKLETGFPTKDSDSDNTKECCTSNGDDTGSTDSGNIAQDKIEEVKDSKEDNKVEDVEEISQLETYSISESSSADEYYYDPEEEIIPSYSQNSEIRSVMGSEALLGMVEECNFGDFQNKAVEVLSMFRRRLMPGITNANDWIGYCETRYEEDPDDDRLGVIDEETEEDEDQGGSSGEGEGEEDEDDDEDTLERTSSDIDEDENSDDKFEDDVVSNLDSPSLNSETTHRNLDDIREVNDRYKSIQRHHEDIEPSLTNSTRSTTTLNECYKSEHEHTTNKTTPTNSSSSSLKILDRVQAINNRYKSSAEVECGDGGELLTEGDDDSKGKLEAVREDSIDGEATLSSLNSELTHRNLDDMREVNDRYKTLLVEDDTAVSEMEMGEERDDKLREYVGESEEVFSKNNINEIVSKSVVLNKELSSKIAYNLIKVDNRVNCDSSSNNNKLSCDLQQNNRKMSKNTKMNNGDRQGSTKEMREKICDSSQGNTKSLENSNSNNMNQHFSTVKTYEENKDHLTDTHNNRLSMESSKNNIDLLTSCNSNDLLKIDEKFYNISYTENVFDNDNTSSHLNLDLLQGCNTSFVESREDEQLKNRTKSCDDFDLLKPNTSLLQGLDEKLKSRVEQQLQDLGEINEGDSTPRSLQMDVLQKVESDYEGRMDCSDEYNGKPDKLNILEDELKSKIEKQIEDLKERDSATQVPSCSKVSSKSLGQRGSENTPQKMNDKVSSKSGKGENRSKKTANKEKNVAETNKAPTNKRNKETVKSNSKNENEGVVRKNRGNQENTKVKTSDKIKIRSSEGPSKTKHRKLQEENERLKTVSTTSSIPKPKIRMSEGTLKTRDSLTPKDTSETESVSKKINLNEEDKIEDTDPTPIPPVVDDSTDSECLTSGESTSSSGSSSEVKDTLETNCTQQVECDQGLDQVATLPQVTKSNDQISNEKCTTGDTSTTECTLRTEDSSRIECDQSRDQDETSLISSDRIRNDKCTRTAEGTLGTSTTKCTSGEKKTGVDRAIEPYHQEDKDGMIEKEPFTLSTDSLVSTCCLEHAQRSRPVMAMELASSELNAEQEAPSSPARLSSAEVGQDSLRRPRRHGSGDECRRHSPLECAGDEVTRYPAGENCDKLVITRDNVPQSVQNNPQDKKLRENSNTNCDCSKNIVKNPTGPGENSSIISTTCQDNSVKEVIRNSVVKVCENSVEDKCDCKRRSLDCERFNSESTTSSHDNCGSISKDKELPIGYDHSSVNNQINNLSQNVSETDKRSGNDDSHDEVLPNPVDNYSENEISCHRSVDNQAQNDDTIIGKNVTKTTDNSNTHNQNRDLDKLLLLTKCTKNKDSDSADYKVENTSHSNYRFDEQNSNKTSAEILGDHNELREKDSNSCLESVTNKNTSDSDNSEDINSVVNHFHSELKQTSCVSNVDNTFCGLKSDDNESDNNNYETNFGCEGKLSTSTAKPGDEIRKSNGSRNDNVVYNINKAVALNFEETYSSELKYLNVLKKLNSEVNSRSKFDKKFENEYETCTSFVNVESPIRSVLDKISDKQSGSDKNLKQEQETSGDKNEDENYKVDVKNSADCNKNHEVKAGLSLIDNLFDKRLSAGLFQFNSRNLDKSLPAEIEKDSAREYDEERALKVKPKQGEEGENGVRGVGKEEESVEGLHDSDFGKFKQVVGERQGGRTRVEVEEDVDGEEITKRGGSQRGVKGFEVLEGGKEVEGLGVEGIKENIFENNFKNSVEKRIDFKAKETQGEERVQETVFERNFNQRVKDVGGGVDRTRAVNKEGVVNSYEEAIGKEQETNMRQKKKTEVEVTEDPPVDNSGDCCNGYTHRPAIKSALKRSTKDRKSKKKHRVQFDESLNKFFDADYVILIREEPDDGVCECGEDFCYDCTEDEDGGGQEEVVQSPRFDLCAAFEPPQEFVDQVTLSPPDGYKDISQGYCPHHHGSLYQPRRSTRTDPREEWEETGRPSTHQRQPDRIETKNEEIQVEPPAGGSRPDHYTDKFSTQTKDSQLQAPPPPSKTIPLQQQQQQLQQQKHQQLTQQQQRYIVETITMTTVTERRIVREAESKTDAAADSKQGLSGILKGGKLWKSVDSDDGSQQISRPADQQNQQQMWEESADARRGVHFCDGQTNTEDIASTPTELTLTFKLGNQVAAAANNSARPNSAVRQLFPGPRFISPPPLHNRSPETEDPVSKYLLTTESLRLFDESKKPKLDPFNNAAARNRDGSSQTMATSPQGEAQGSFGGGGASDDEDTSLQSNLIKRTIERNTLRRSLLRYPHDSARLRRNQNKIKNENSLVERIKQLTLDVDEDVSNSGDERLQADENSNSTTPFPTRSSPPGEESKPPPTRPDKIASSGGVSSTYRKLTDLFTRRGGEKCETQHPNSVILQTPASIEHQYPYYQPVYQQAQQTTTSPPDLGNGLNTQNLKSTLIARNSVTTEARKQFLSTLAPLTACVSGSGEDSPVNKDAPGERGSVASTSTSTAAETEYSLDDIDEALLDEQGKLAPRPDVVAGTPAGDSQDELALFVQQDAGRIERLRKRYNSTPPVATSEDDEQDDYGFNRRPSVRGIKPRFGSTTEIIQQMQTQLQPPPAGSHVSWPYYAAPDADPRAAAQLQMNQQARLAAGPIMKDENNFTYIPNDSPVPDYASNSPVDNGTRYQHVLYSSTGNLHQPLRIGGGGSMHHMAHSDSPPPGMIVPLQEVPGPIYAARRGLPGPGGLVQMQVPVPVRLPHYSTEEAVHYGPATSIIRVGQGQQQTIRVPYPSGTPVQVHLLATRRGAENMQRPPHLVVARGTQTSSFSTTYYQLPPPPPRGSYPMSVRGPLVYSQEKPPHLTAYPLTRSASPPVIPSLTSSPTRMKPHVTERGVPEGAASSSPGFPQDSVYSVQVSTSTNIPSPQQDGPVTSHAPINPNTGQPTANPVFYAMNV